MGSIRSHTASRTSRHWTKLKTPSNMAPTTSSRLVARDCDRVDIYGNCYYSTWDNWGRWVALVLIVLFFLFLGLAFSCISQRRRRLRRRIWGTRRRARLFRVMMDTMDMEIRDMDSRVVALSCSSRERVISRRGVGIMFMRRRWVRLLERGMGLFARV